MDALLQRFVGDLVARLDGPLHFRFIVQPLMAFGFAITDGLKDARTGKPAYFWALVNSPEHRQELLRDGWKHWGKVFLLAIVLDVIYQLKVQRAIYPGELLLVSLILAVVPYLLLRGPISRIVRSVER